jgi:3',5'-cyclic AMP phosphodiesterase CpdA
MRLQIFSDLHIDVVGGFAPRLAPGADVVVMPGDVCEGVLKGMAFLRAHISRPTPIVLVMGNHEFYHHGVYEERLAAAQAAQKLDITVLDDAVAVISGVRFVGATLWTDFCLGGEGFQQLNMLTARTRMNDYRTISLQKKPWARFTPQASLELHRRSRTFIAEALEHPFDGPTVVVTHHAPHPKSVHQRFDREPINPAYVSDLTAMIETFRPPLWLHGHVHNSFDYRVADTRVVCNPRGYGDENAEFNPALVIEV